MFLGIKCPRSGWPKSLLPRFLDTLLAGIQRSFPLCLFSHFLVCLCVLGEKSVFLLHDSQGKFRAVDTSFLFFSKRKIILVQFLFLLLGCFERFGLPTCWAWACRVTTSCFQWYWLRDLLCCFRPCLECEKEYNYWEKLDGLNGFVIVEWSLVEWMYS